MPQSHKGPHGSSAGQKGGANGLHVVAVWQNMVRRFISISTTQKKAVLQPQVVILMEAIIGFK